MGNNINMRKYRVFHGGFTPSHPGSFSLDRGSVHIENRKPHLTTIPGKNLFEIHSFFSRPLAWLGAHEYMQKRLVNAPSKPQDFLLSHEYVSI